MRGPEHEPLNPQEEENGYFPELVELPLEDVLDLHTFSPKETPDLIDHYIQQAYQAGFKQIRIIHGKGKGVQRTIVHSLLAKNPYVQEIETAPPEFGGWGATIVFLKQGN
jgi:dsDNA-specific endonuclease/ATPase MutS2